MKNLLKLLAIVGTAYVGYKFYQTIKSPKADKPSEKLNNIDLLESQKSQIPKKEYDEIKKKIIKDKNISSEKIKQDIKEGKDKKVIKDIITEKKEDPIFEALNDNELLSNQPIEENPNLILPQTRDANETIMPADESLFNFGDNNNQNFNSDNTENLNNNDNFGSDFNSNNFNV